VRGMDICGIEEQVKVCHRGAGKVADDTMGSTGVTRTGTGVTGKGTGVRRGPLPAMGSFCNLNISAYIMSYHLWLIYFIMRQRGQ
jgi:hypothetical protein